MEFGTERWERTFAIVRRYDQSLSAMSNAFTRVSYLPEKSLADDGLISKTELHQRGINREVSSSHSVSVSISLTFNRDFLTVAVVR
jgi:hypothetical protein